MARPLTVCFFGAYRPNYPRNLTIRRALAKAGVPVVECQVPPKWPTWRRWPGLLRQFLVQPAARNASIIFVAEFSHTVVPLAWLLARVFGARLVFDPVISFYDEMVVCQKAYAPQSLRGRYLRWLDAIALHLSDRVLWFTPVDKDFFDSFFQTDPQKSFWLQPGIDETLFVYTPAPDSESPFIIHWDGSFIASHGVEVIVEAANLLKDQPDLRFEIVGDGPTAPAMRAQAAALQLPNLTFTGQLFGPALFESVHRAHICLGVFRADDKGRRSLYTKELQGMLMGRPVITADGEAKRRVFVNGQDLWLIPPDSPKDLAEAIQKLRNDPVKRQELSQHGHTAVEALCTAQAMQARLLHIFQGALSAE